MIDPVLLNKIRTRNKGQGLLDAGSLLSSFTDKPNEYGRSSVFSSTLKATTSGGQLGMTLGGPVGAGIGAGVGAITGLLTGISARNKERDMETRSANAALELKKMEGANFAASNPEEIFGNKYGSYFKRGGKLSSYSTGGDITAMKKVNSTGVEFNGPSHEQGGIKVAGAEVEGGETMAQGEDGVYVMSNMGGISNTHRDIMRRIGKVERKPMTPERINTLKRLRNKEQLLIKFQQSLNGNR